MKYLLGFVAVSIAFAATAHADEYEPVGKGFAPPAVYSWTGFYAGLHAGGAWSADTSAALSGDPEVIQFGIDGNFGPVPPEPFIPSSLDPDPSGFIGGVQVGYNWRKGSVVFGFEADVSYSDLDDSDHKTLLLSGAPLTTSLDTEIKWFSTVRGRVGFLPHEGWMVFATGGLAFGETQQTLRFTNPNDEFVGFGALGCLKESNCLAGSNSETSVGWTAGGGFEFAVSDHVTLKGEYLYVDLGSSKVTATPVPGTQVGNTSPFLRAKVENQLNVIRAGLNVKLY